MAPDLDEPLARLCSLLEPVRRDLYRHVVERGRAVSRDEAAVAVGISRSLAAYHLDKLLEAGLLDARFARRGDRTGPGAGRPAKLYERSALELGVSVPSRSYRLAAELLAQAVAADASGGARVALERAARSAGRREGATVAADPAGADRPRQRVAALRAVLAGCGYEPHDEEDTIRLGNCPFQRLVADHRDLICRMNLALLRGVAEALDWDPQRAVMQPQPGACCVVFATT